MEKEALTKRTKMFAHRCVKVATSLKSSPLANHIRSQLIRCSTSVAANYRAALLAQSKAAFKAKLSIVLEEADESIFWLEFIIDENLIELAKIRELLAEANELTAIFYSSRKTLAAS